MKKYTVIIADDEKEIIEGIIQKVDFESVGFVVIAAALNGMEAYQLALKLKPDIVMSDIIMPFMDGLTLAEHLKQELPNTKMIIFSGHDDLDYAHRAIKMNVVEYVLKPVNAVELKNILTKLKQQLDNEYEMRLNYEFLNQKYQEILPVLKEQFLVGIMEGKLNDSEVKEQAEMAQFKIDCVSYCVILFEASKKCKSELSQLIFKEKNSLYMMAALKNLIEDVLTPKLPCSIFLYDTQIACICQFEQKTSIPSILPILQEACDMAQKIYEISLDAGVSLDCNHRYSLCYALKEAQAALDYHLVIGDGKVIFYQDIDSIRTNVVGFQEQDSRGLSGAIRMNSKEKIELVIHEIFSKLYEHLMPLRYYHIFLTELMLSLLKLINMYKIESKDVFGKNFDPYHPLDSISSLPQFEKDLIEYALNIGHLIQEQRIYSSKHIVSQAMDYMLHNYSDPNLNVETIARKLHISPSYLSTIFKKEKDESLIVYLTDIRMDEAARLLQTTNEKSYMVAEKVGYADPNYFSYVFKKRYGVAPTRYRKKLESS